MWLLSDKVTVRECGLLEGFCDWHCHLLPGVDDGVETTDETLAILQEWESAGVREVWLTPHIMEDIPNRPDDLKARLEDLQKAYRGSIRLHLAAEHMMDGLFIKRLEADCVMPMVDDRQLNGDLTAKGGGMLLVETSYFIPPMNMQDIIDRVKAKGYQPLLAHPERYQYMEKGDYRHWKDAGVLMQLNLPSLVGAYGAYVQSKAEWLLREGIYDCCGTDTHSTMQTDIVLDGVISRKTAKRVQRLNKR